MNREVFFETIARYIQARESVYQDIKDKSNITEHLITSTLATVLFGLLYGMVMGTYAGGIQIFYDAIKIPLLLLVAVYVSLPTFFVLNGILGGELSFRQMAALFAVSITAMATLLISFLPVTLFFMFTTPERTFSSYAFTVLLNVFFFTISGFTAVAYLLQGFNRLHGENKKWIPAMVIGTGVLAFVGTQLAWVLRPYFHLSLDFIAPPSGNFYIALFGLIARLLFGG